MMPFRNQYRPIKPMGKSVNEPMWLRCVKFIGTALLTIAFATLMAVLVIEWMAGCGESYVDANGVRHQNECVFIPNQQ